MFKILQVVFFYKFKYDDTKQHRKKEDNQFALARVVYN